MHAINRKKVGKLSLLCSLAQSMNMLSVLWQQVKSLIANITVIFIFSSVLRHMIFQMYLLSE